MNPTEINIAIAEACGWKFDGHWWAHPTFPDNGGAEPFPPDYCADLNAINDAVLYLCRASAVEWANQLYMLCRNNHPDKDVAMATAPARQRAQAFLVALGKWKD